MGGLIPNPLASTLITGTADAAIDYTPKNGWQTIGDKPNAAVFGDLLFNVGLGSANNGFKQQFPESKISTNFNDFMIQYGNTIATQSLPE